MKIPWIVAATLLYCLTAFAFFVAPVIGRFGSVLLGSTPFPHDALLNAGILEWGFRAIWDPGLAIFDWPAGFPLKNTLAGTEHLLGWQPFYEPLRAAGLTVAASYNVVLLLSLVLSGIGTAIFARRLGASRAGSTLAGFLFAFNPIHVDHAIHLQTMTIAWSPFALLGLEMTLSGKGVRGPLLLAVSFLMTALCGMYFAVFLPIVLVLYASLSWVFGRHPFSWRAVRDIVIAGAVSAVVLVPVLIPYFRYASSYGAYPHPESELATYSLSLASPFQVPPWLAVWGRTSLATGKVGIAAFPGIVASLLAIVAIVSARKDREVRGVVLMALAIAVIAFTLALGPVLMLNGSGQLGPPWFPLPGRLWAHFSAIRWPVRIFLYSALFATVLAGIGFSRVQRSIGRTGAIFVIVVFLFASIELRPAGWYSLQSLHVSDPIEMSDAYPFLAAEQDRGGVVEIPQPTDSVYAPSPSTGHAYASAGHLRGVVAFHGSLFPPLLEAMRLASYKLPDSAARELFVANGVTRLVIHKDMMPGDSGSTLEKALVAEGYPLLFATRNSSVFALDRRSTSPK